MSKVILGVLVTAIILFLGNQFYGEMQERNLCSLTQEAEVLQCEETMTLSEGGFYGSKEGICLCTPRRTEVEVMFNAQLLSSN